MKASNRRKLKSAGWKLGSADEFLELSAQESAYIEMKLALSEALKRMVKGLSQSALAKLLAFSQSRVAKKESGDPSVSIDLLVKSLLAMGRFR